MYKGIIQNMIGTNITSPYAIFNWFMDIVLTKRLHYKISSLGMRLVVLRIQSTQLIHGNRDQISCLNHLYWSDRPHLLIDIHKTRMIHRKVPAAIVCPFIISWRLWLIVPVIHFWYMKRLTKHKILLKHYHSDLDKFSDGNLDMEVVKILKWQIIIPA